MMRVMTWLAALVLVLPCVLGLRGVNPANSHYYENMPAFTCIDGSARIAFASVNDDFCDCADGSDEPGTSACATGVFYCANTGHAPLQLQSSRVFDGICDCCDGTDEKTGCANTCDELGRAAREEAERLAKVLDAGYAQRLTLRQQGSAAYQEKTLKLAQLEKDLVQQVSITTELEVLLTKAEEIEQQAKSSLDAQWEETKAASDHVIKTASFRALDKDGNERIGLSDILAEPAFDADSDGTVSEEEAVAVLDVNSDSTLADDETLISYDGLFSTLYPSLPEQLKNPYNVSVPVKEEYPPAVLEIQSQTQAARTARDQGKSINDATQDEIQSLKDELALDYGVDYEFLPLRNKCFDLKDSQYRYEICLFKGVTQYQLAGSSGTNLGNWKDWSGSSNKYSGMLYDGGEKCWNGPNRSTKVELQCGSEDAVVSVLEPNRCEYAMIIYTPVACTPAKSAHDEL